MIKLSKTTSNHHIIIQTQFVKSFNAIVGRVYVFIFKRGNLFSYFIIVSTSSQCTKQKSRTIPLNLFKRQFVKTVHLTSLYTIFSTQSLGEKFISHIACLKLKYVFSSFNPYCAVTSPSGWAIRGCSRNFIKSLMIGVHCLHILQNYLSLQSSGVR